MMNETLQKELSAHLRVINGRDNFIKKWVKKKEKQISGFGRDWEGQDEIIKLIHLKAKSYLDKKKFNYGKDRDYNASIIIWDGDFLRERGYKQRRFNKVDLAKIGLWKLLPKGFGKAVEVVDKKLSNITKLEVGFKGVIKLNKRNNFQSVYNTELRQDKAIKIILSNRGKYGNSDVKIDIEGEGYLPNDEWAYHNTRIFKKILKLINKFEKNLNNLTQVRERLRKEAEDFVSKDFDKILILESLKEND